MGNYTINKIGYTINKSSYIITKIVYTIDKISPIIDNENRYPNKIASTIEMQVNSIDDKDDSSGLLGYISGRYAKQLEFVIKTLIEYYFKPLR